jgi:hypothetical protein
MRFAHITPPVLVYLRNKCANMAILAAIRRALTVDEVNSDTSHSNSHTDNNSGCNIDTETPTPQYEHNQNCRNDKSPVSSGLGDRPSAFLPLAQAEWLYSGAHHSQAT